MGVLEKNYAGQECYIVEYDEDQWYRYTAEQQEETIGMWLKKAKPMGAVYFVLRLHPDPLFPRGDKSQPYVFRSIPIDRETFDPFKVTVKLECQIDGDVWLNSTDGERMKLKADARVRLGMNALASPGCGYAIWARGLAGEVMPIEKGRF